MAVSGVQFSEHQLNTMYQQQMLTEQQYRQWVMTLPAEQQMHLQQGMQARMQQVQVQMAQMLQHYSMNPPGGAGSASAGVEVSIHVH